MDDGERSSRGPLAFGRRVRPRGDDDLGPAEDPAQQEVGAGKASGNRDLGPVQDHAVGTSQVGAQEADREGRVQDHELGADLVGQRVDAAGEEGLREQHRVPAAHHPEGLVGVELGGPVVGRGEDGERLCGQPPPQLPEVGLDPAELGREVVGDEEVLHPVPTRASSRSRAQAA